jgi:hypothetical protein
MEFRELTERYDLAKILHSGRSATVLRATDRRPGTPVAVKMITAGPGPLEEAAVRFESFAAALAMLRHPALPAILDSGISTDGSAFLVLELLEGRSFDAVAGRLDPDAAVAMLGLLGQALDGLEALAGRGLAHGNMAPENLFAASAGGQPQVKLLGLGTAAFRGAATNQDAARFLAPELAEGGVASARSDLFSFARVACHALGASVSGDPALVQLPFAVTLELANDDILRTILERMLRREPAERPSFREVRSALRQALGTPAVAPAPAAAALPALPPLLEIPELPEIPEIPPAAVSPPAPPPAVSALQPEPEILEGEVLRAITDEVLDALTAAPPPAPETAEATPAAPAGPSPRRKAVLFGALAAVLILAVLAGVWLFRRPAAEPAAMAGPAAPAVPPPPSPQAVLAQLDKARLALALGDETSAREALRDLSSASGQSALPREACGRLADLESMLDLMAVERFPSDLQRGLQNGDLGLLRSAVAAGAGLGTALPADLKGSFDTARHLVELHRLAEADTAEGKHASVLERMAEMATLSPKLSDPLDLREKAAAALEGEAEALAREARYDEAVAKLEPVQRTWSGRDGLAARVAGYRGAKEEEARQKALLDSIPSWEHRKKPNEPLEMMRGLKPTPHLAAPIEAARQRLEAQLAELDRGTPVIELRPGFGLEYSRGTPVELGFRVSDDYQVRSVKLWVKPPGGKMKEMTLEEHLAGGYWSVELPVSYHQNGTVEFYVQATDLSGHEGWFGTKDKPMKVTRIGSNRV